MMPSRSRRVAAALVLAARDSGAAAPGIPRRGGRQCLSAGRFLDRDCTINKSGDLAARLPASKENTYAGRERHAATVEADAALPAGALFKPVSRAVEDSGR